ncbi:MAG: endo-1,4-beta-xylanase [Oscillospiraceae bacterium]|nr:endo-1,4-beta-xylanase [Oscillospiraceae bacterium]
MLKRKLSLLLIIALLTLIITACPNNAEQVVDDQGTTTTESVAGDTLEPDLSDLSDIKPEWDLTLPALKDVFAEHFAIGNIMEPGQLSQSDTTRMFLHHYNFVTAENCMKPSNISRATGSFNFGDTDRLIHWAETNNFKIHGHTLVWHSQSAAWLTTQEDRKTPLTREEARNNMELYINEVAGRYAGQIHSWDVVNEAFLTNVSSTPDDWRTALRAHAEDAEGSPWYKAYDNGADHANGEGGWDYIYDAYVFARAADPNAILYYNDFNETYQGKRNAIAMMVEELNEIWKTDPRNTEPGRLLIEGIGMQAHYWTSDLKLDDVEDTIIRFIETGVILSVSEIDIPLGSWRGYNEPTESNYRAQAYFYGNVFEIFLEYSEHIERVTFWGKQDNQSWRKNGYPMLFDEDLQAKPSYWAVVGTMGYTREDWEAGL